MILVKIPDESDQHSGVKPTINPLAIRPTFRNETDQPVVYDRKATVITSQLPIKAWHDAMQDQTLADAILDRLVHNAYKLELKGESMRKKQTMLDQKTEPLTSYSL